MAAVVGVVDLVMATWFLSFNWMPSSSRMIETAPLRTLNEKPLIALGRKSSGALGG